MVPITYGLNLDPRPLSTMTILHNSIRVGYKLGTSEDGNRGDFVTCGAYFSLVELSSKMPMISWYEREKNSVLSSCGRT